MDRRQYDDLVRMVRAFSPRACFLPFSGASQTDVADIETRLGTPASGTVASQVGSDADVAAAAGSVHAKIKELRTLVDGLGAAATFQSDSSANPTASQVLADTGQLAAGEYEVTLTGYVKCATSAFQTIQLQHRNAANAADIRARQVADISVAGLQYPITLWWPRITVALNERIRLAETQAGVQGASNVVAWTLVVRAI